MKNAGLVRLARSWGALGLLLVLAISGGAGSAQAGPRAPVPEKPFQMPGRLVGTATHFEIKDSKFLNINLDSSRVINLTVESVPEMIIMRIGAAAGTPSTAMTISGLKPSTTYHKYEDTHRNHAAFTSDAKGRYTWTQNLSKPHLVFIKPRESTKYIGGPSGQDCGTIGIWNATTSTCTLTQNVNETIEIVSNAVTLDGAGHTITPAGACNGYGVYLFGISGATIQNLVVDRFSVGIVLWQSNGNKLQQNVVTSSCQDGIVLDTSDNNSLIGNAANNDQYGFFLENSKSNKLTSNLAAVNSEVGFYVGVASGGNTLGNNIVELNKFGIVVDDHSNNNTINCNTIRRNTELGTGFYLGSKSNTVFGNNFGDNLVQAYAASSSPNSFNLGSPNSGNYWRNVPSGYVSPFTFSGGTDNKPLQNPQDCMAFKHCLPSGGYTVDLSTGTTNPFVADSTNPPTPDPDWKVTIAPNPSLQGPARSIPLPPYWIGQPYSPVGPAPVPGVANWIAPNSGYLPTGYYTYEYTNPKFAGPGTLIINGIASDDGADLYLDNSATPIFSRSTFYWLSPLMPLSIPVGPGSHSLTAKVRNGAQNQPDSPSGLLMIAEFCPEHYDLEIKKTISPNPLVIGQPATVTITVKNVGNVSCSPGAVGVHDPQPGGLTYLAGPFANQPDWLCSHSPNGDADCGNQGPLPPGYSVVFTIKATVTELPGGQSVFNCATVSSGNDTNSANNKSCVMRKVFRRR